MNEEDQNTERIGFQSILLIVLLAIGVGIIFLLQAKDSKFNLSGSSKFQKGKPAPDFSLPNLDGTMISLADYKGKVYATSFCNKHDFWLTEFSV